MESAPKRASCPATPPLCLSGIGTHERALCLVLLATQLGLLMFSLDGAFGYLRRRTAGPRMRPGQDRFESGLYRALKVRERFEAHLSWGFVMTTLPTPFHKPLTAFCPEHPRPPTPPTHSPSFQGKSREGIPLRSEHPEEAIDRLRPRPTRALITPAPSHAPRPSVWRDRPLGISLDWDAARDGVSLRQGRGVVAFARGAGHGPGVEVRGDMTCGGDVTCIGLH